MRDRFFRFVARLVNRHATAILVVTMIVFAACAAMLPGLRVRGGHAALAGPDNLHEKRYADFLTKFGSPDLLFVMLDGGTAAERRTAIDQLVRDLESRKTAAGKPLVASALGNLNIDRLLEWAFYFLEPDDLTQVVATLEQRSTDLQNIAHAASLADVLTILTHSLEQELQQGKLENVSQRDTQSLEAASQFLATLLHYLERQARGDSTNAGLRDTVANAIGFGGDADRSLGIDSFGYLTSYKGDTHVLMVRAADESDEPEVVGPFVGNVRTATQQLPKQIAATITGYPALIVDETEALEKDLPLTGTLSTVGVFFLFAFFLRSVRQSLLAVLALVITLTITMGLTRVFYGELNMMTSASLPMLIGLCIDYAVHILMRFNEERRAGRAATDALDIVIRRGGPPLVTSALTMCAAFSVLATNEYSAFAQMSVVGALGLMIGCLVNLIVLPAFLATPRLTFFQRVPIRHGGWLQIGQRIPHLLVAGRVPIVVICAALTVFMLAAAQRIPWSYNYLDLLPAEAESVRGMERLATETGFSIDVAALRVSSKERARKLTAQLEVLPTVARVESIATFLPTEQAEKHAVLQGLAPLSESLAPQHHDTAQSIAIEPLHNSVTALGDTLEDTRYLADQAGITAAATALKPPIDAARNLETALEKVSPLQSGPRLAQAEREFLSLRDLGLGIVANAPKTTPLTEERLLSILPPGLGSRLVADQEYAMYVYPRQRLTSEASMTAFVDDVRRVDPLATGFPVTHWEATASTQRGVQSAIGWCGAVILLLVFLDFRRIRYTLLAMAPLAVGVAWMWGSMALLNMDYNLANIFAFPLIIGVAIDYSVHLLHRYREEDAHNVEAAVEHTGAAIFLCAASNMVGFGSLIFCSHRGAASVGATLLLGVGACLIATLVFLPALLAIVRRQKT